MGLRVCTATLTELTPEIVEIAVAKAIANATSFKLDSMLPPNSDAEDADEDVSDTVTSSVTAHEYDAASPRSNGSTGSLGIIKLSNCRRRLEEVVTDTSKFRIELSSTPVVLATVDFKDALSSSVGAAPADTVNDNDVVTESLQVGTSVGGLEVGKGDGKWVGCRVGGGEGVIEGDPVTKVERNGWVRLPLRAKVPMAVHSHVTSWLE